jgi:hypothetical protein
MSTRLPLIILIALLSGCAPTGGLRLQDINPARTYNAEYEKVLDTIRMYAIKEGFKLDRFETEFGTIIGHKTFSSGGSRQAGLDAMSQVIVMKLSVKRQSVQRTDLNAGFTFGGVHMTSTKDDEDILVYNYTSFFDYMNDTLTE